jgi:hypothetical protein
MQTIRGGANFCVRVVGGIGNQMYCYAFGQYLKEELQVNVCYDEFSGYLFDKFNRKPLLNLLFKKSDYIKCNLIQLSLGYLCRRLPLIIQDKFKIFYINEKNSENFKFTNSFNAIRFIYFDGYWQDSKYVYNSIQQVKRLYIPPGGSGDWLFYRNILSNVGSLILHVRQKDIDQPFPSEFYQSAAIRKMINESDNVFYITDLKEGFTVLDEMGAIRIDISNFENKDILEFELLRLAKKKIICNSTFSYWAGYLSDNTAEIYYKENDCSLLSMTMLSNWHAIK